MHVPVYMCLFKFLSETTGPMKPKFMLVGSLILNVAVKKFSVMLGRSHRFLGITSTFWGENLPCSRTPKFMWNHNRIGDES